MVRIAIRCAALVAACAMTSACGTTAASRPQGSAAPAPAGAAPGHRAPSNSLVGEAGTPNAVPLDAAQREALSSFVARMPAGLRPRLRYAVPIGADGKPHLVVYDGQGLGAGGRHPGRPREYIVFRILNANDGEHYDPQENAIVAPITAPPQRDDAIK